MIMSERMDEQMERKNKRIADVVRQGRQLLVCRSLLRFDQCIYRS